jgi:cation diffusion facilitator family transporter
MMFAEIMVGLLYGSMALLADGIHMGTHFVALLIAFLAYVLSRRHSENLNFAFGTGKIRVLAGYSSSLILLFSAAGMLFEAIQRLVSPRNIDYSESVVVASIGLLVNLISALLLKDSEEHNHAHHHEDHNYKAAYIHVIADALTSVMAIFAIVVARYLGWLWVDPIVAICGGLVVIKWGIGLIRSTGSILLDYHKSPDPKENMYSLVKSFGGDISDLHIWRLDENRKAMICEVSGLKDPKTLKDLEKAVRDSHCFVHFTIGLS